MRFKSLIVFGWSLLWLGSEPSYGVNEERVDEQQRSYEESINAVVRNKYYYKKGKFELGFTGGLTPYDSVTNHLLLGGRLSWHLSDHYGWELVDLQLAFPSLTSFTTNLVSDKGISNLQAPQIKYIVATNFLLSPLYSKIRFFGSSVLYLDIYLSLGLGIASTETVQVSAAGTGQTATESVATSGTDPLLNLGLGFKFFLGDTIGLLFDLRNYVIFTEVYGSRGPKSNFTVFLGLNFYLPTFG